MPEPLFPTGRDRSGGRAERAVRRALAAEAAGVDPGPVPRVGQLVDRSRPRRWPAALGVAAAVGVLAVTSAVALRPDASPPPVAAPSVTASSSTAATTSPSMTATTPAPSAAPTGTPSDGASATGPAPTDSTPAAEPSGSRSDTTAVVWACLVDDDGTDPTVSPERRTVAVQAGSGTPMTDQEARVAAAVEALDVLTPLDPDYVSFWAQGSPDDAAPGRTDVRITGTGTTVDFSGDALSGLATGATVGCLTETLVRTVVSNGGDAPVTFLLDGQPAAFAELDFSGPAQPSTDLLAGGWILDPYQGQRVRAGTVTLAGTATAFEATVGWAVLDQDGATVAEGFTMAGSNGDYGPWSVPVDLAPGRYTAVLWADDMAGTEEGPGPRLWEDTKDFTVVP